jgi:hypothetical protein
MSKAIHEIRDETTRILAIERKVAAKEAKQAFIKRALAVNICPDCGNDLDEQAYGHLIRTGCNHCNKVWEVI